MSSKHPKTGPAAISVTEKQRQCLELRKAGADFQQIADRLGYRNKSSAYRACQAAMANLTKEPAEDVLNLELARLDAMFVGLWPQARTGDPGAVQQCLRIQERRAKYLGLDDYEARMADVAERHQALAEQQGELLAGVVRRVLDALDLSDEQRSRAPEVAARELRAVTQLPTAG